MKYNTIHQAPHFKHKAEKQDSPEAYGLWSMAYGPNKSFTLIELMIVVIIIAALAAMVVPRLGSRSDQAKVAVAEADIGSNIGLALKLYKLDNGRYPTTSQGLKGLLSKSTSSPVPGNWNGPYLERDPLDPWKNTYQYKSPGSHNADSYDLYSVGTDGVEGTEDDVNNW